MHSTHPQTSGSTTSRHTTSRHTTSRHTNSTTLAAVLKPVGAPKGEELFKWAAGTAWLLSVWALIATAGAAEITPIATPIAEPLVRTAILPPHELAARRGRPAEQTFRRPVTAPTRTRGGDCPECRTYRTNRPVGPNYRDLFQNLPSPIDLTPTDRSPIGSSPDDSVPFGRPADQPESSPVSNPVSSPVSSPVSTPLVAPGFRRPNYEQPGVAPGHRRTPTSVDKASRRYGDPQYVRMGQRASVSEATTLFLELSDLIDRRHVSPAGYETRTRAAIEGVAEAIALPSFHQAAGRSVNGDVRQTQQTLASLARRPARSSREAVGLMQQAASIVNRDLGLPTGLVAMEFVHATMDSLDRYSSLVPTATAALEGELPKHATVTDSLLVETRTADARTADARTAGLEENIVGIGVEMKSHPNGAIVEGTVDGGPAASAGLRKGDVISRIDGRRIGGLNLTQIADLIGGRAGSQLRLDIDRDGQTHQRLLTRRSIYVSSVAGTDMLNRNVGYVRLKQFSASSRKDLESALWTLHRRGMQGLVLDLRGNPGGLLTSAIEISDLFLPSGSIVSTRGRTAEDQMHERASFSKTWSVPLVVLIDEGSASASEILAAAIQENDRGVIVGSRSYGKGTVQTHFPLRSIQANAKLTTAKFYSPKGREMAGAGVLPDVTVDPENDAQTLAAAIETITSGKPRELAGLIGTRR